MAEGKKDNQKLLPAIVTDYIGRLTKKFRYRKKVRAEIRQELQDHFEDALRDIKPEKRQEAAEKLISDFGDPKLLAILMRRAKKRCRPLWKKLIVKSFQAFGILILCLILYIIWFATGKPSPSVNYLEQVNTMVRPVADESSNAQPLYIKAAKQIEGISEKPA